jgi:hypothetical protein
MVIVSPITCMQESIINCETKLQYECRSLRYRQSGLFLLSQQKLTCNLSLKRLSSKILRFVLTYRAGSKTC